MKRLLLTALLLSPLAQAQEEADLSALQLADTIQAKPEAASNWRSFFEGALGGSVQRGPDSFQDNQRASIDTRYDNSFATGWRLQLSDRLDYYDPGQAPFGQSINTLREAYLSWQVQPDLLADLGRINERNGVALGYNPTDYFKTYAVRSAVSVDPNSLKENRQGSVMLRGQALWDSGSLSLVIAPGLNQTPDYGTWNPDFGATNQVSRELLYYSPKLSENFNPKFLLFKAAEQDPQVGFNLTSLINDATVVYVEWSGGRSLTQLAQAEQLKNLPFQHEQSFRNRSSTGLTYTTDDKISLTFEVQYNGQGMDADTWNRIGQTSLMTLYGAYRQWLDAIQESPTKNSLFAYASWQDAGINRLDLSAMEKYNVADASRLSWLEARYHLDKTEFALQWQQNSGKSLSEFGALPQNRIWSILGRFYF